jgi:segregation and condensation protein B
MSLKAKLEAVIYASEEPVTLAQLTGLLGEEAQAELDALESNQQTLALDAEADAAATAADEDEDTLNAEVLEPSDITEDPAPSERPGAPGPGSPTSALARGGGGLASETWVEAAPTPAVDEKKLQRERDKKLRDYFRFLLDQLIADYAAADRGFELVEVAGGYRLRTKPEYHDAVRGFVKSLKPPLKLSLQALETLAVVAYKQPVTAPEVSEIRGVDSAGTLGSLITRKLVTTAGRKQVIGRPMLYKTTKDFLLRFGLKDIAELPSIEEFEKMAGELNGELTEPIQEQIPMDEANHNISEETGEPSEGSAPLAELDSAPQSTHVLHDSPEDLMADDSTAPEGERSESHAEAALTPDE